MGGVSLSRFAFELSSLGFSGFVAAGENIRSDHNDIMIWSSRYLSGLTGQALVKEVRKPLHENELVYVSAGDAQFNRTVLSTPGVNALMDLENTPKDGFDRFCAQIAGERGVAIGISIRPLVELKGVARQKVIRKYEEIFTLQKRYEFPVIISSHAQNITHIRSVRSMLNLLGGICDDESVLSMGLSCIPSLKTRPGVIREV